jgi:signal transduction histidine kinase
VPRTRALSEAEGREARRSRSLRWLFAFGLAAWTSLGTWWGVYLYRTTRDLQSARLEILASRLGLPPLSGSPAELEHLRALAPDAVARLEQDFRQKMLMLGGEGSLLIGLLLAVHVALYRGLVAERRLHRQRDSFVHAVTHELKSPIAGLRALLQSFQAIDLPTAERAAYVSMGLDELTRLDHMVGNILLSARLDAAGYVPQLRAVDAVRAIRDTLDRRRLVLKDRGARLTLELPARLLAYCDAEALDVVLGNLVDNALKYASGVPSLTIAAWAEDDRMSVTVSDGGAGFAPEEATHLFEKFHRTASGERLAPKGTGLGLYIARGLVRACDGELSARSEGEGRGATFTLVLPLAAGRET